MRISLSTHIVQRVLACLPVVLAFAGPSPAQAQTLAPVAPAPPEAPSASDNALRRADEAAASDFFARFVSNNLSSADIPQRIVIVSAPQPISDVSFVSPEDLRELLRPCSFKGFLFRNSNLIASQDSPDVRAYTASWECSAGDIKYRVSAKFELRSGRVDKIIAFVFWKS